MIEIYGLLISMLIGTIGHFLYNLTNKNKIIGFFFSQNESTWEHIKLGITPIFLYSIIEIFILKNPNVIINTVIKIIVFSLALIILYYGYKIILKKNILILDILTFYIALTTSYLVGINNLYFNYNWYIYIFTFIFLIALFYAYKKFSKNPPNCFLFKNE